MKKIILIVIVLILVGVSAVLIVNRVQKIREQEYINEAQKKQAELDKNFSELVKKERQLDPLMPLLPIETTEFNVHPYLEEPYTYYVESKGADKDKAKEAFEKWVKERNLDISNLHIRYD